MSRRPLRLLTVACVAATLTALAWPAPGPAAASVDGTVTIPLDPAYVEVSFPAEQNVGTTRVEIPLRQGEFHPVEATWGGTVTVTMPPQKVDTGHVGASLTLETDDGTHTGAFSTDPTAPAEERLPMASLGANRYRIGLPADDGTNGPVGRLQVHGLELRPGLDVLPLDPPSFVLHLSPQGPASAEVDQQTVAVSCPPGRPESAGCATTPPLPAGGGIRVTLPMGSTLRALGLPGLRNSAFALQPRDPQSWPSRLPGTALPASVATSDGTTATMTVPAGTVPGPYQFTAVVGDSTGRLVSITALDVEVVAAPPSSGAGSTTGATPPTGGPSAGGVGPGGDGSGTPGVHPAAVWVPVGAGGLLAAAAAVVLILRHRHARPHRHA